VPKVEDPTHCRSSRARVQEILSSGKQVHHSRVQQDLAATLADVGLDGDQRHVVPFSDAALNVAATIEITPASGTESWSLCGHYFTRLLRSAVHRAGSGW
jgi:hypothetical protein